ncbi:MAG: FCSD flavin-binding domain-containing protein [Burkholderiales bacterium]
MAYTRRDFIRTAGLGAVAATVVGCSVAPVVKKSAGRVVVIGAGFAGATAAKYIRLWAPDIEVTLIEPGELFISCPISNLVLNGSKTLADVSASYGALRSKYGITFVRDTAIAIDVAKQQVRVARSSDAISYDRLIVAPGVQFVYDSIPGLKDAGAQESVLHAWKAGPQTVALRKQLEAMTDGGVFVIHVPKAPYRCPPGPYERACLVADYFKKAKPKSKVLILDSNEDVVSKKPLFTKIWKDLYPDLIEYRPNSELVDVDAASRTVKLTFDDVKADVLNVLPPMKAGKIAESAGLITANNRWCEVDFLTYESKVAKNVHVLGDAILAAPAMPKSGHMANGHGKNCASAVVALMKSQPVNLSPMLTNTCYSFVTDKEVIHIASVHRYDEGKKTMVTVDGSGGLSPGATELEGQYALAWAKNIWADMLA